MSVLKRILFKMAKSPFMGTIVGGAFQTCAWAIPVKKVYGSRAVIAFYHPQPCYENHVILSPRRVIRSLQTMARDGLDQYFEAILQAVQAIRAAHPEYGEAFELVANGGKRQEVWQVHFHLFTGDEPVIRPIEPESEETVFYRDGDVCLVRHPQPGWETHFVAKPASAAGRARLRPYLKGVLRSLDLLDEQFDIARKGYSLVYQEAEECPIFHITAGRRI